MADNYARQGNHAAGTTAPLKAAFRPLLQELRRLVWQIILLGSGLWLAVATSLEGLVVRLASSFEEAKPPIESRSLNRSFVSALRKSIGRVVRRAEPRLRAWRERAKGIDAALLSRRGLGH
jgi:hypothetical protein